MGSKVTTLSRLPESTGRSFFVYFLDYGWDDELTRAMYENFDALAEVTENRSLLKAGLRSGGQLPWFQIQRANAKGLRAAADMLAIQPNVGGFGIDQRVVCRWSKEKWQTHSCSKRAP